MSGYTRQIYDACNFGQRIAESTAPLFRQLYRGAHVNGNRCHVDQARYYALIDFESELKNISRLASKCNMFKYHPACKSKPGGPNMCISTFDPLAPTNLEPRVCPDAEAYLYFNSGLRKPTNPGFYLPDDQVCAPETVIFPKSLACGK